MLAGLSAKLWLAVAALLIALVASCCLLKQCNIAKYGPRWWNRQQQRDKKPRPPRRPDRPDAYDVLEVQTGASMRVANGRRQLDLNLWGVAAPSAGQLCFAESTANLKALAGDWVRVEEKGSLHPAARPGEVEGRRNVVILGVVYGQSGQCLQLEQAQAGFVRVLDGMPAEWRSAEAEARKARRGMWQATE